MCYNSDMEEVMNRSDEIVTAFARALLAQQTQDETLDPDVYDDEWTPADRGQWRPKSREEWS